MSAPSSPTAAKDLEALVPVDIHVKFGRPEPREFVVPGDFPLEPYLHWTTALDDDTNETTGTKHLQACLTKLLLWYDETDDSRTFVEKQIQRLGVASIITIVQSIYERKPDNDADTEQDGAADVGPTSSGTTPTTTGPSLETESPTLPEQETPQVPTGDV
jgi:hypothetical protein